CERFTLAILDAAAKVRVKQRGRDSQLRDRRFVLGDPPRLNFREQIDRMSTPVVVLPVHRLYTNDDRRHYNVEPLAECAPHPHLERPYYRPVIEQQELWFRRHRRVDRTASYSAPRPARRSGSPGT